MRSSLTPCPTGSTSPKCPNFRRCNRTVTFCSARCSCRSWSQEERVSVCLITQTPTCSLWATYIREPGHTEPPNNCAAGPLPAGWQMDFGRPQPDILSDVSPSQPMKKYRPRADRPAPARPPSLTTRSILRPFLGAPWRLWSQPPPICGRLAPSSVFDLH